MKKTAQLLKETRERQGISLNAVSSATKISVKFLEAIENGDLDHLPPKTFLRGFVQTYAQFLKLDPKHILDLFAEEVGSTRYTPAEEGEEGPPGQTNPSAVSPTPSIPLEGGTSSLTKWLLGGVAVFLFVAIYAIYQVVQKYQKESIVGEPPPEVAASALTGSPSPEESRTPAPETSSDSDDEASPTPSPAATAAPALIATSPSPVASPTPAATVAPLPSPSPRPSPSPTPTPTATPTPVPSPSPKPSPSPTLAPTPAASPRPSPVPTVTPAAAAMAPQEVTIESLDTVKIDYRVDGGALQSFTLQPEQTRKISAKRSIVMDVSDGGAISVFYNGKDRGVPGNLGQALKLNFPPKE